MSTVLNNLLTSLYSELGAYLGAGVSWYSPLHGMGFYTGIPSKLNKKTL